MESADALVEEKKLMNETKYRNYMSNIDKALKNFEYSSEWADLISALGKLSKAISSYTQYQIIPRRIKISKRLAQCMHPALPSGVHLKALETYDVIFSKTGSERLATELFIYSAGLFPLLGYAAMNVRPTLLEIYEKYFVPLGEKLRPALSGFLSGVLPGYESGLDHFERTNSLLMKVCTAVNPIYFYTVVWECVATNASIRLPAISYLVEHFNKRTGMQEQIYIMGHNHDVMMAGLCACLNDAVILVQRNTLEFLLLGFPMHTIYLAENDLIKLVTNGLYTILRRDMSLNRRLYAWLLGTEVAKNNSYYVDGEENHSGTGVDAETEESYFEKHSKQILIKSLVCTFKYSLEYTPVDLKPYKIMVSLLDKAEIGPPVLDYVLCDVIRTMSLCNGNYEVGKSANLLFATFDPAYIWNFMTVQFEKSCKRSKDDSNLSKNLRNIMQEQNTKFKSVVGSGEPSMIEICYLTEFLLETISLEMYNETTRIYLPKVFLSIAQLLTIHSENLTHEEVTTALKLCMKIVSRVQPMITPVKKSPNNKNSETDDPTRNINSNNTNNVSENVQSANALEKSKSDSKLNQFSHDDDDDEPIRRSNSNHFLDRKNNSPKKSKKAKSYSKLLELDKEICPDTGQFVLPSSSSELDTPLSIKKLKQKKASPKFMKSGSPKKQRPQDLKVDITQNIPEEKTEQERSESAPPKTDTNDNVDKGNQEDSKTNTAQQTQQWQQPTSQEYSILEKCIRQYEIFYEIYLSRQILHINTPIKSPLFFNATSCPITVKVESGESPPNNDNIENIFENETIFENGSIQRTIEIDQLFETLRINVVCRSAQLHNLLNRSLAGAVAESSNISDMSDTEFKDCVSSTEQLDKIETKFKIFDDTTEKCIKKMMLLRLSESLRNTIKLASNLLVEMSTFPNCKKNLVLDKNEIELPSWLKVLTLVACYTQNDKELQLAAITTLFDLISLLRSQIEHTTSPGVTFVVMLPLLKFGHVSYIEHKTRIFQLITSILWNYLNENGIDPAQISSLLYQLHSCLDSGLVEQVIACRMSMNSQSKTTLDMELIKQISNSGRNMTILSNYQLDRLADLKTMCVSPSSHVDCSEQLKESESQSFKKFELLWHLGREKKPSKTFEKTLLRQFDTLALPVHVSIRTFVTKWLQEALLRGDLQRLIKPLNRILLSPKTKRISIVHVHLLKKEYDESQSDTNLSRDVEDDPDVIVDRDVYAISSEYGNVKYHMDSNLSKKRSPIRSLQKKFFGVTLGNKNKTSNFVSDKVILTESESSIGLIINPLDNSPDFSLETDVNSLSSSAPNKMESVPDSLEKVDNLNNNSGNNEATEALIIQKDYFNSSTEESDESSNESTIDESRETSVEKEITSSSEKIKKFSGEISQTLSKLDRTKNRKTYHLKQVGITATETNNSGVMEKFEANFTQVTDGQQIDDTAHTAEEYFSSSAETTDNVESFVNNLIDEVVDNCDDSIKTEFESVRNKPSKSNSIDSTNKKQNEPNRFIDNKKRASCISKTSTDSNFSVGSTSNGPDTDTGRPSDSFNSASENEPDTFEQSEKSINIEDKRKSLSLETAKIKDASKTNWELTEKTMEKGKQNVEILRKSAALESLQTSSKKVLRRKISEERKKHYDKLHPFHTHILLYHDVYDTQQTYYAFQTLRNIISTDPRTFLCLSITTSISSGTLKQLLIRHRKCILGKGFNGSIANSEFSHLYRGCMYLEVLFTICLYYARSYFHKDAIEANDPPNLEDIKGNCKVQLESIELLTMICQELVDIVKGMGKGLACYIADLMAKCKLQKILLHCVNSSVLLFGNQQLRNACNTNNKIQSQISLSEQILLYNYPRDENLHAESFQIQLLRLLMAVIKLEYEVYTLKNEEKLDNAANGTNNNTTNSGSNLNNGGSNSPTKMTSNTAVNVKYLPNSLISQQPMFLSAVLSALQSEQLRHLHRNWNDLVTSSLNCFSFGSLTNIVISVVHQLCNNLDRISKLNIKQQCNFPPDYIVSQLEAITILCHYCLLDNTQQTTLSHLFNQAYPQTSSAVQSSNTGQLLNNIVHSFLSSQNSSDSQHTRNIQHLSARNAVLSHLSKIVATVAAIWDSELGQIRQVKQQLMEFLSPVSLHHGTNFLAAVAVTWQERGEIYKYDNEKRNQGRKISISEQYLKNSTPQASQDQLSLVKLVSSIRVMPMDSFVSTLHQVVKSPPPIHRPPVGLTLEVSALELFYFYLKSAPAPQLGDSWTSLLALLRDGINLSPPAQFVLLMLLNEFVQRCPQMPFQDKKDIRDLHDVTSRLIEALSNVAAAGLEQTTWLRRNLAVKEDISPVTPDGNVKDVTGNQQYYVQAQSVLAATLANLLDVAYGSQEKDKVVNVIIALMYNITPYLKNHTTRNIPSFYACSSLLASLSGYQYTRKAWRKDMFDLLLDNAFFQMDHSCLPFWKQIMDSLMTYDNTTFRELMSRMSLTQSSNLNIFSSKEQEYEQRALLLKRLAFVIFCSELDQYHKYMPEIQEQLVNSLRLPSVVPAIQAAVFLCFRVLLLRMSPDNVTSLWPIIIAEMVQVFLTIEQELKLESDEISQQMRLLSGMDVPWAVNAGNGLTSQTHLIHWRAVQLEASKLLELGCILPATNLPHFQMYRWAFVGTEFDAPEKKIPIPNGNVDETQLFAGIYVPHVRRIARLMDMKYTVHSPKTEFKRGNHLVLTCQQITSLQDLYGFFLTLSVTCQTQHNFADTSKEVSSCLNEIEEVLSKDFLEKMPTSTITPR
ncbi:protein dopey-1 homolog isoform X2 [Condylostylus longicornis]|uniref:protein dopey-1 homolog isoform X2 n=1 Tax=Condylostylus longicornis TaxID=2530218 RepID=UPI00244DE798|nr:protein dopey-1 homolog isoform X2 [Condylostylus longicornis]